MNTIPLNQKDFSWVLMNVTLMKKKVNEYLLHKKKVYAEVKAILPEERTFLNTVYALERCDDPSESFLSKMGLLSEVSPSQQIRDEANRLLTELSSQLVDIEYDRDIYISLVEYHEGNYEEEKKKLRKEDIRLFEYTLKEYKRMGFDLPEAKQKKLKSLLKKTGALSIAFRQAITEYQDYILCTKEELEGLSEIFVDSLPRSEDGKYIVTLQYPHITPFLGQAKNRKKREELARKNLKKGGKKNLKRIEELVKLRHEIATLLGYKHHADFRTENRLAKTAKHVEKFQDGLLKKLAPLAKKDLKALRDYSKSSNLPSLEFYDIGFVATELKKKLYDVDPEVIKSYFPLDHVCKELFALCERLFSIRIEAFPLKLWHKDVTSYCIKDSDGSLIGYFALDLYPREGKFSHAAMFDVVVPHEESYKSEAYVAPFSVMVCNFAKPYKKGKKIIPSLLPLSDVETLFHEFGHLLHMTLSKARLESHAGANVAWDFVETPSQIMENWVWSKEMLTLLSSQYETGEKMDKALIERILKGKTFQSAYFYTRQLIHGKLDLDLHTGKATNPSKTYRTMSETYFNITLPEKETLFPAGFGHLVGYDAGYYSYLWALVYACDAFTSFKKKGNKDITSNTSVGMKWRKEILEKGGSADELALMTKFLGREPSDEAFLKEVIGLE